MTNDGNATNKDIISSYQSFMAKNELFSDVLMFLPFPVEVYAPDGTSVYVNKAMLDEYHVADPDMIVGKYNIFEDPYIIASGRMHEVRKAFQGEVAFFHDIKVPLEDISQRYGIKDLDVEAIYQDITIYPILNEDRKVKYVVAFLINRRVYRGRNEIEKAKEYIESHWLEKFDLDEAARTAGFSKAHFIKLFKQHTGITPHDYYINYKISRLREMLMDANLTIAQAFAACNMDYNGYSAGLFKKITGLTPSDYRKMIKRRYANKQSKQRKDNIDTVNTDFYNMTFGL